MKRRHMCGTDESTTTRSNRQAAPAATMGNMSWGACASRAAEWACSRASGGMPNSCTPSPSRGPKPPCAPGRWFEDRASKQEVPPATWRPHTGGTMSFIMK
eukprot:6309148-Prymnesium_polylepis.3